MIAREHDVNANMVFRWQQQYQDGAFGLVTLLSVEVEKAKIRIADTPDPQTLQLTLQQLLR